MTPYHPVVNQATGWFWPKRPNRELHPEQP